MSSVMLIVGCVSGIFGFILGGYIGFHVGEISTRIEKMINDKDS